MSNEKWRLGVVVVLVALAFGAPMLLGQDMAKFADKAKAVAAGTDESDKSFLEKWWGVWMDLVELGGATMWYLFGCSIIAMASLIERAIFLTWAAIGVRGPVEESRKLWAQGRFQELLQLTERRRGITAKLIHFMARHHGAEVDHVTAGVTDMAGRFIRTHMRRNYPLAVMTGLAPLLGLYGTIIGMIEAFDKVNIAGSMGSAEYLSGAISKALITTAAGLVIAMPALFMWNVYKFLTGVMMDSIETKVGDLISDWFVLRGEKKEAA
jgi:biopolymer transport protein ExbB